MKSIGLTPILLAMTILGPVTGKAQTQSYPPESEQIEFATELLGQSQYQSAASIYEDFIRQFPHSPLLPNAYVGAGDSHFFLKEPEAALAFYQHYENQFPNGKDKWLVLLREAQCLYLDGKKDAVITKLTSLDPHSIPDAFQQTYHFYLGTALMDKGHLKEAANHFEKVIEKKSTGEYATLSYLRLAAILSRAGNDQYAAELYNSALQSDNSLEMQAKIELMQGLAYLQSQQYDMAAMTFEKIVDGYPTLAVAKDAAVNWFIALLKSNQADRVISEYNQRFKDEFDDPLNGRIHLLAIEALLGQKRYNEALSILNTLIAAPAMSEKIKNEALFQVAHHLQLAGETGEALKFYRIIINRNTDPPLTLMSLKNSALIYAQENDQDKAAEAMDTIITDFPSNDLPDEYYSWLAGYWQQKKDTQKMLNVLAAEKKRGLEKGDRISNE